MRWPSPRAVSSASLLVVLGVVGSALAQVDTETVTPDARQVAATVQAFYAQTTSFEVDFRQTAWTKAYARTTADSRGHLRAVRPGRVRLDYTPPARGVAVVDGDDAIYYDGGDEASAGQYYRGSGEDVTRAFGFLIGSAPLEQDYRIRIAADAHAPADSVCLELRPRRPDPNVSRIWLFVSTAGAASGAVLRVSVEDPAGNWNRFEFQRGTMRVNPVIDSALFDYTPPAGAREVTAPSRR